MSAFLDWLRPALTPVGVATLSGFLAGAVAAFWRLTAAKADRSDLERLAESVSKELVAIRAAAESGDSELRAEVTEVRATIAKSTYDLAQALGSLNAVHRRLDEQGRMLEANNAATFEIARAVGARRDGS